LDSLAKRQLLAHDFAAAEASARRGLALAPQQTRIQARLAAALLYQGNWQEVEAICGRLNHEPYMDATFREAFLEDLAALEAHGITHPDVQQARALLR
jgi:uncharacterized protein HemY